MVMHIRTLLYVIHIPSRTPRTRPYAKCIKRPEDVYNTYIFFFFQNRVLINYARRTVDHKRVPARHVGSRVGGVIGGACTYVRACSFPETLWSGSILPTAHRRF